MQATVLFDGTSDWMTFLRGIFWKSFEPVDRLSVCADFHNGMECLNVVRLQTPTHTKSCNMKTVFIFC